MKETGKSANLDEPVEGKVLEARVVQKAGLGVRILTSLGIILVTYGCAPAPADGGMNCSDPNQEPLTTSLQVGPNDNQDIRAGHEEVININGLKVCEYRKNENFGKECIAIRFDSERIYYDPKLGIQTVIKLKPGDNNITVLKTLSCKLAE